MEEKLYAIYTVKQCRVVRVVLPNNLEGKQKSTLG